MSFFLPSSIRCPIRRAWAREACNGMIQSAKNPAIVGVFNDGSDPEIMAQPGAARFSAERRAGSWSVCFDWRDGVVHRITIQLPDDLAIG